MPEDRNVIRITETARSYRDEPGTVTDATAKLEAQGWVVQIRKPGYRLLAHPQIPGASREIQWAK